MDEYSSSKANNLFPASSPKIQSSSSPTKNTKLSANTKQLTKEELEDLLNKQRKLNVQKNDNQPTEEIPLSELEEVLKPYREVALPQKPRWIKLKA